MNFEKVLNGIKKYIDKEIFASMTDWQKVIAGIALSRITGNSEKFKNILMSNPVARAMAIIDDEGNVDVDGLMNDIRDQIRTKGKIEFSVPLFGNFKFTESDVDKLHSTIRGDWNEAD